MVPLVVKWRDLFWRKNLEKKEKFHIHSAPVPCCWETRNLGNWQSNQSIFFGRLEGPHRPDSQLAARPLNVELFLHFNFECYCVKSFSFLFHFVPATHRQSKFALKLLKGMKSFENLWEAAPQRIVYSTTISAEQLIIVQVVAENGFLLEIQDWLLQF